MFRESEEWGLEIPFHTFPRTIIDRHKNDIGPLIRSLDALDCGRRLLSLIDAVVDENNSVPIERATLPI